MPRRTHPGRPTRAARRRAGHLAESRAALAADAPTLRARGSRTARRPKASTLVAERPSALADSDRESLVLEVAADEHRHARVVVEHVETPTARRSDLPAANGSRRDRGVLVYATRHARAQARELGLTAVLENQVERAIKEGKVGTRWGHPGRGPLLGPDDRLVWLHCDGGGELAAVVRGVGSSANGYRSAARRKVVLRLVLVPRNERT